MSTYRVSLDVLDGRVATSMNMVGTELVVTYSDGSVQNIDLKLASLPGPTGAQGPAGLRGSVGVKGQTGNVGPVGARGAVGPAGTVAGPRGATGPSGLRGAAGPAGIKGVMPSLYKWIPNGQAAPYSAFAREQPWAFDTQYVNSNSFPSNFYTGIASYYLRLDWMMSARGAMLAMNWNNEGGLPPAVTVKIKDDTQFTDSPWRRLLFADEI